MPRASLPRHDDFSKRFPIWKSSRIEIPKPAAAQPAMSEEVLRPKLDALIEVAPDIVATANPGCAMQLAAGLAKRGFKTRIVHPIELLEEACRSPDV
jgi:Fe-S oxidoreductase